MTRIETTAEFATHLSKLVHEARDADGSKHILCYDAPTRARIASAISEPSNGPLHGTALPIWLPRSVDQVERVVLSVGHGLGPDVLAKASEHLTRGEAGLRPTLDYLHRELGAQGKSLVVVDPTVGSQHEGAFQNEIWRALSDQRTQLYAWLKEVGAWFVEPPSAGPRHTKNVYSWALREAPLKLSDIAPMRADDWSRLSGDAAVLEHHLLAILLAPKTSNFEHTDDLLSLIGERGLRILELLAVHERPIDHTFLVRAQLASQHELDEGVILGLWLPLGSQLVANPSWAKDALSRQSIGYCHGLHRALGEAFAAQVSPADPNAKRLGLSLLEAHRHLLLAGEWSRALSYARFGTALLVERAQTLSREAQSPTQFSDAARLYEQVVFLQDRYPEASPPSLRAYTIHYLHYNRAKAEIEPMHETRNGYQIATDLWPEHALFWSRLIRLLFYEGRRKEAMEALQAAKQRVPDHLNKIPTLIERTVDRLLKQGLFIDAVEVWGDYRPPQSAFNTAQLNLERCLSGGWRSSHLALVDGPSITFTRPAEISVSLIQEGLWQATIEGVVFRQRGPSPITALRALILRVRARCDELLQAYTHTLDAKTRLEKQVLLGLVDVVSSGLDAPLPRSVFMLGNLRREDGVLAFHSVGARHDVCLLYTSPSPRD